MSKYLARPAPETAANARDNECSMAFRSPKVSAIRPTPNETRPTLSFFWMWAAVSLTDVRLTFSSYLFYKSKLSLLLILSTACPEQS